MKSDVLYIDSGIQRFNISGKLFLGISTFPRPKYMVGYLTFLDNHILNINMTETWDWKTPSNQSGSLSIGVTRKNVTNPDTGTTVPNLIRGHLFHGPSNSSQIYNFGGTTYMSNQSFEGWAKPQSSFYPLWTYDPKAEQPWGQYSIGQKWKPNHGAAAEDMEKGIGFYLGGQIDMGTSTKTWDFGDDTQNLTMPLEGMLIIDLMKSTSTNISTSSMNTSTPRVGGSLDYIDTIGDSGILVALGGQIYPDLKPGELANRTQGKLVSEAYQHISCSTRLLPLHSFNLTKT